VNRELCIFIRGRSRQKKKDSKSDVPAILPEASIPAETSFSEDQSPLDDIPSSRGPEKPLITPLLPQRSNYVSDSVGKYT